MLKLSSIWPRLVKRCVELQPTRLRYYQTSVVASKKPNDALLSAFNHCETKKRTIHLGIPLFFGDSSKIVLVPPFPESIQDGDIKWEKNVGDSVSADETVAEIETDKTSIPVPAPASGVIEERFVQDGATVTAGMKLFRMKVTG